MPLGFTDTFASMPVLTHATERDVDFLIVEEIVASKGFVTQDTAPDEFWPVLSEWPEDLRQVLEFWQSQW